MAEHQKELHPFFGYVEGKRTLVSVSSRTVEDFPVECMELEDGSLIFEGDIFHSPRDVTSLAQKHH